MPKKRDNVVKLPARSKKEADLIEAGSINRTLTYKLFNRGNIEITDGHSTFRKDCDLFRSELVKHNYDKMKEGETVEIPGAGDTDPLLFTKVGKDVSFRLGNKLPKSIEKVIRIIGKV